jgi:pimeloyl-ACP methyl ester carboxylesterase
MLVAAGVLFSLGCGGGSRTAVTNSISTPSPSPTAPFRSPSGGYVRGPAKGRVIVFVNGIFGDAISTWRNPTTGKYWPAMLNGDSSFSDADIFVHSFQSPKMTTAQNILQLAQRMKDHLQVDGVLESHRELVFLCHSMGGLVTRRFLLDLRPSPEKVPMIYFFGTPTEGANVAGIIAHISANPQLEDMRPLVGGGYLQTLREEWLATADSRLNYPANIASFCAYELKDTWGFRVVAETSATSLCNHATRAVLANHLEIVKPSDAEADSYKFFKAAYERRFSEAASQIAAALRSENLKPVLSASREVQLMRADLETVLLKQVKATRQYIAVGCEEEKTGEIDARVDLEPGEDVIEVQPTIGNAENIKTSSVALIRHNGDSATVSYRIRGLDRVFFNCPGGGHADIVVNFVVSRTGVASHLDMRRDDRR